MYIRHSTEQDLPEILDIYAFAREQMKKNGNPTQWGDHRPSRAVIERDIDLEQSYVVCEDGEILGVFAFTVGAEPTYLEIENGSWLNDEPYGVIHRVASAGKKSGVLSLIFTFCEGKADNIRIDTHDDNKIMQHLLERHGYQKCGRIHIDDGSPRIAYQKITG